MYIYIYMTYATCTCVCVCATSSAYRLFSLFSIQSLQSFQHVVSSVPSVSSAHVAPAAVPQPAVPSHSMQSRLEIRCLCHGALHAASHGMILHGNSCTTLHEAGRLNGLARVSTCL